MNSMTGYGRAAIENARFRAHIALRSVNHRSLDVVVRMREPYRASEAAARRAVAQRLARGRVEAVIEIEALGAGLGSIELRMEVVASLVEELAKLRPLLGERIELSAGDVLGFPGAIAVSSEGAAWQDPDEEWLLAGIDQALDELIASRSREGAALAAVLSATLEQLVEAVRTLDAQREVVRAELADRYRKRIVDLAADTELDPGRLAQEVAILLEKSDVAEELDRLRGHCEHFASALGSADPVGKRLDFLAQEIARELNTLAAKSRDLELTRVVLDARLFCERLREQVQNVE